MKKLIILFLFLNTGIQVFSQPDTVFKDRPLREQYNKREQYYVLKEDRSVKHGSYIKYFKGIKRYFIYEIGKYSLGKKEGLWRFFYDDYPPDQLESQGYFKNDRKDGPWEFFYFTKDDSISYDINSTQQNKVANNEYSVSFEIKGTVKYAGTLSDEVRIGTWDYYDIDSNLILKINHSNDSVEFINPTKMQSQDSCGIIRPFYCGGKEYLNTMTHRKSVHGIDKTGIIVYRLYVNKNLTNNRLRILSNTSSDKTAQSIMTRLNTVLNDWVPQIRFGKIDDSEIDIIVTVTSDHYSTNIMLRKDPDIIYNSSGDFYHFKIEY